MKKILFISCLLIHVLFASAQSVSELNTTLINFRLGMLPETPDYVSLTEYYDGSPFLEEEWQPGKITFFSGRTYEYPMKYMVYADQIWVKDKQDSVRGLTLSEQIKSIEIGDKTFVYGTYSLGYKQKNGVLEMLYPGIEGRLLLLYTCTIEKGREGNGYQKKEKDRFVLKKEFYYQIGEEMAKPVPRSKKDFFAVFNDRAKDVEKFSKDNKLKIKRQEDLIKIFSFYDDLRKQE